MVDIMKGLFITFEGGEGSGKTTLINKVYEKLLANGKKVYKTREPGGVEIAEQIRGVILNVNNTKMDKRTEALLYAASRRQHLIEVVIPKLEDGYIVLCDRYIDSSLAYQGYARGLGIDKIKGINDYATDGIYPDLTLFINVHPEVGIRRIMEHSATHELNRLDKESMDFHKRTHEGYEELVKMYPERIKSVDGERTIKEVAFDCFKLIKEKL